MISQYLFLGFCIEQEYTELLMLYLHPPTHPVPEIEVGTSQILGNLH